MVGSSQKPCRFDVFLVSLDPTQGAEIQKTRPGVILSPDEMNHALATVIVAPLTTVLRSYPTRISLVFRDKKGQIAVDQLRTLDQNRLLKKLGTVSQPTQKELLDVLKALFCE
jgi:mRNA interferase MazF